MERVLTWSERGLGSKPQLSKFILSCAIGHIYLFVLFNISTIFGHIVAQVVQLLTTAQIVVGSNPTKCRDFHQQTS